MFSKIKENLNAASPVHSQ